MMTILIQPYLFLLLTVGLGSVVLFAVGLYCIFHAIYPKSASVGVNALPLSEEKVDVSDFAGDDVITTQLDLARAYIETDKQQLAKTILQTVLSQGNSAQQEEAQQLLSVL